MKKLYILPLIFIAVPFINQAQNIGIGEASPSTKLEIKGDGNDLLNVKDNSNDSKLFIDSDGNVGVGTSVPNYKLDVKGAIAYNLSGHDQYTLSVSNTNFQELTYGGNSLSGSKVYRVVLSTTSTGTNTGYVGVVWYDSDVTAWNVRHVSRSGTSSNHPYLIIDANTVKVRTDHANNYPIAVSLQAFASDDDDDPNIFGADYMWQRVGTELNFPDGNVGIGVSNPSFKLDVAGTGRYTGQVTIPLTPTSNEHAASKKYVDDQIAGTGDNLGNHSATTNLDMNAFEIDDVSRIDFTSGEYIEDGNDLRFGSNSGYMDFRPADGEHGLIIRDYSGGSTAWSGIRTETNGSMQLRADGGSYSQMTLIDGGNVGIGTASPSQKLELTGGSYPAILISNNSSGRDLYLAGGSQSSLGTTEAVIGVTNGNLHIDSRTSNQIYFQHYAQNNSIFNVNGGSVGIGTSSPSKQLHTSGNARVDGDQGLEVRYGLLGGYNQSAPGSGTWGANIWSIGSSWNGSGYGQSFTIESGQYGLTWLRQTHPNVNSISSEGLHIYRAGTLEAAIGYNGAQFMNRVVVDGTLAVGATSPGSYQLYVNGKIGSNGINETSDIRFKKDIEPLKSSLEKLLQLRGVSYHWRHEEFPDKKFEEGKDIGVIAQEVEKLFPELVNTDDEGYKAVEYSHLVPVLIEAIKEQQAIIEFQKQENLVQAEMNKNQNEKILEMLENIEVLSASVEILKENQEMTSK